MAAVCTVGDCGIEAFARCATCSAAYCRSHAGRREYSTKVDQCKPCQDREYTTVSLNTGWAQRRFLEAEAARRLNAAGIPKIPIRQMMPVEHVQKGLFRTKTVVTHEEQVVGHAWELGPVKVDRGYRASTGPWDNATDRITGTGMVWVSGTDDVSNFGPEPTMDGYKQLADLLLKVTGTTWDPYTWKDPWHPR